MKELFAGGVLKLVTTWQKMLQTAEYNLIVIEEEQVPLAPGDALGGNRFLPATLIGMSILLLGTVLTIYWSRCRACRVRINQLGGNGKLQWNSWNLRKLKETVNEMEWQLAGEKKAEQ
ncbi:MAG: hypothetical protein IJX66_08615 [Lachnospiraceae bacterium]|nr:hypothetical protein [Lachnospiraceae bacterium]